MRGTKTKTTGQQNVKDGAGAISSTEVAPIIVKDGARSEPAIVLPGHYIPVGAVPLNLEQSATVNLTDEAMQLLVLSALPDTDDVEALEVHAVSERGFWRCGRIWPRQPVHVFASDDPVGDNAANNEHLGIQADCFISHADAARLKAESQLVVTVIETVTEPD